MGSPTNPSIQSQPSCKACGNVKVWLEFNLSQHLLRRLQLCRETFDWQCGGACRVWLGPTGLVQLAMHANIVELAGMLF